MSERPKVVTLCGSSRFCDVMAVVAWIIERDERSITMGLHLLPGWYSEELANAEQLVHHLAENEGCAEEMDRLHLAKIDLADEVFVVNYNDYIGASTGVEVEYAKAKGKPLRWFTHDRVGNKVKKIIQAAIGREEVGA
ncbi:MAG: hypothetical protein K9K66_04340 [Desulfarculaceae bacterium]|nr:hypothetical protein [Desulfarculaceae bacterium]MCF8073272.1 hypothetical protein [Desulfarculaceae bacterium]MCF8100868.1 hypothetical protein [Desulfarculaceae bacterium]